MRKCAMDCRYEGQKKKKKKRISFPYLPIKQQLDNAHPHMWNTEGLLFPLLLPWEVAKTQYLLARWSHLVLTANIFPFWEHKHPIHTGIISWAQGTPKLCPVSSLTSARNAWAADVAHHGKATQKCPDYRDTTQNGSLGYNRHSSSFSLG